MIISPGIQVVSLSLWLPKEKTLVISDIHLGYEEVLQQKGILVPKFQLKEVISCLDHILQKTRPETVVINGDLKHEFGKVLRQEWKEVLQFLDFLQGKVKEIIIVRGNHDPVIAPIALRKGIKVVAQYRSGNLLLVHGDELVETDARRIIIGHEHPAFILRQGSKREKYKCFLKGKWKGKELIAMPSFNPLLEGTDILKEKLLSPFLREIKEFKLFVVNEEEVFPFGKVKDHFKEREEEIN